MSSDILLVGRTVALSSWNNVLIEVFRELPDVAAIRGMRPHLDRIYARNKVGVAAMVIIEPSAIGAFSPELRAEAEAQTRNYPSIGTANVIEVTGFKGAAMRTMIAGMHLIARTKSERRVFEAVTPAADWIAFDVLGRGAAEAAALRAFAEHTRAAMDVA